MEKDEQNRQLAVSQKKTETEEYLQSTQRPDLLCASSFRGERSLRFIAQMLERCSKQMQPLAISCKFLGYTEYLHYKRQRYVPSKGRSLVVVPMRQQQNVIAKQDIVSSPPPFGSAVQKKKELAASFLRGHHLAGK